MYGGAGCDSFVCWMIPTLQQHRSKVPICLVVLRCKFNTHFIHTVNNVVLRSSKYYGVTGKRPRIVRVELDIILSSTVNSVSSLATRWIESSISPTSLSQATRAIPRKQNHCSKVNWTVSVSRAAKSLIISNRNVWFRRLHRTISPRFSTLPTWQFGHLSSTYHTRKSVRRNRGRIDSSR